MKVNGNLDLQNNLIRQMRFGLEEDFPTSPQPGRVLFKNSDRTLYICAEIGDLPIWVPLTQVRNMYRHTQTVAAMEWTIPHNLGMAPVLVQVYDLDGKWILPDETQYTSNNAVLVKFSAPTQGQAVILRGALVGEIGEAAAYEQSFTNSTTWVVTHGLGYNPDIKVYVDNKQVQPASIVHDSVNQTTVTFTTAQTGFVHAS
jgi:hypothetical protein